MSTAILYLFLSFYLFLFCSITNVGASSKKDVGKMPEEKVTITADVSVATDESVTIKEPSSQGSALTEPEKSGIPNSDDSSIENVVMMSEVKATGNANVSETTHGSLTVEVSAQLIEEKLQQRLVLIDAGKYNLVPSCIYSFS